ncbi:MAG: UDP-N-acetylmuramate--L-alanine ligase [Candidatus Buchananbacteria bacterium]
MNIDLTKIKTIYFIGIKGVAMSGLAVICRQKGMTVFGSDVQEKFITDKILADSNIEVFEEFNPANLDCNPDLVVVGTSWGNNNVEVAETEKRNLPSISDSKLRGLLSQEKRTIAVTGVHGKTTTTGLLAYLFSQAGLQASFLVGTGIVPDLKSNAAWAGGKHFIVEGDEYIKSRKDLTPKFLDLNPSVSLITSLEWEHVDVYPNIETMEAAFAQLILKTKNLVVACGDWPSIKKIILGNKKIVTYGFNDDNFWQPYDVRLEFDQTIFKLKNQQEEFGEFRLKLFGNHNVLNATAAIIIGLNEGIELEKIRSILAGFLGTERRFDVSERNGITFVDDYGHHPTAIKTTLQAIRHRYPSQPIWCVFQPHMASRTKALLDDFAQSFSDADLVLFADIFASAREQSLDITSQDLAQRTKEYHKNVVYSGDLNETINYLRQKIKPGLVLVTMGAGDVYRVRDKLANV